MSFTEELTNEELQLIRKNISFQYRNKMNKKIELILKKLEYKLLLKGGIKNNV